MAKVNNEIIIKNAKGRLRSVRPDEAQAGVSLVKYLIKNEVDPCMKSKLANLGLVLNKMIL